jgi:spermidine synthase
MTEPKTAKEPTEKSQPEVSKGKLFLFFALLTCSGLCGISYEILYGRILGNLIGDQFIVSASILLTFLLGIGLGTFYAHKLWRHLWLLEGAIGVYGVIVALSAGFMDDILYTWMPTARIGLMSPMIVGILLLLTPAFLIGTSLPIFSGYAARLAPGGKVFAKVYALYNFGAAFTVILIEFWLVRSLGIQLATICIAAFNAIVAVGLIMLFPTLRDAAPIEEETPTSATTIPHSQIVALALASVASAIFQLLMIKLAECVVGPYRETFALVLCLVLLGIAMGSSLVHKFRLSFRAVIIINLISFLALLAGFDDIARLYAHFYPDAVTNYSTSVLLKLGTLGLIMFVQALTFGATIPALITESSNVARESGYLLFVSSLANAFGFLIMTVVLHQNFDYGGLLLIISVTSTTALFAYKPGYDKTVIAGMVLLGLSFTAHATMWDEDLLYLGHTSFHSSESLKEEREDFKFSEKFKGPQDIFSITWSNGKPYFFINGYISIPLNASSEKVVGALSSCFAPRNDKALVLGVGSGATAATVGLLFDKTVAVEINGVVLENLFRMKKYNFDIESNPKVEIVHDDAIHYTKVDKEKYSLIINTVTTPLYFSSSKLYTQDFFKVIKQRLEDDGIYVTWIDRRVGNRGINIMLKSLGTTFEHCAVNYVSSSYFLLLCSDKPIRAKRPRLVADHPVLGPFFLKNHDLIPEWLPYRMLIPDIKSLTIDESVPLNTLDFPALEFEMAQLRKRGYLPFQKRIRDAQNLEDLRKALTPEMKDFNPVHLVVNTEEELGNSRYMRKWREQTKAVVKDYDAQLKDAELYMARRIASASVKPGDGKAYHKFGFKLLKARKYKEAISYFQKALKLEPKIDNSYFNMGACYERMNQFEKALEAYKLELVNDPKEKDVPLRLARMYLKLKRTTEALRELEKAKKIDPGPFTDLVLGQTYEALGRYKEAAQAYRKSCKIKFSDEAVDGLLRVSLKLNKTN